MAVVVAVVGAVVVESSNDFVLSSTVFLRHTSAIEIEINNGTTDTNAILNRQPCMAIKYANGPWPNTPPPNPINIEIPVMPVLWCRKVTSVLVIFKMDNQPAPTLPPMSRRAKKMRYKCLATANSSEDAAATIPATHSTGSGLNLSNNTPSGI